jgi:hypothetical protein
MLALRAASKSYGAVLAVRETGREERAAAYGIETDQLEEHYYRELNSLKVKIHPWDIPQAALHVASVGRSGKSSGKVLDVDGGAPAAYPR